MGFSLGFGCPICNYSGGLERMPSHVRPHAPPETPAKGDAGGTLVSILQLPYATRRLLAARFGATTKGRIGRIGDQKPFAATAHSGHAWCKLRELPGARLAFASRSWLAVTLFTERPENPGELSVRDQGADLPAGIRESKGFFLSRLQLGEAAAGFMGFETAHAGDGRYLLLPMERDLLLIASLSM
ncbi:hypothetical protein MTO96_007780 [Rhipicephalus appendiculatus]